MAKKPRPNELPKPIDEMDDLTRPLTIDAHLTRGGIIEALADETGLNLNSDGGTLYLQETARLYVWATDQDQDGRTTQQVRANEQKWKLIEHIADEYGFPTRSNKQDAFTKSQLAFILIAEATGTAPDPFQLPSDCYDFSLDDDDTSGRFEPDPAPVTDGGN